MVQKSGDGWQTVDTIWISNGETNTEARVQIRVEFAEVDNES
jgi:hypothetical protein